MRQKVISRKVRCGKDISAGSSGVRRSGSRTWRRSAKLVCTTSVLFTAAVVAEGADEVAGAVVAASFTGAVVAVSDRHPLNKERKLSLALYSSIFCCHARKLNSRTKQTKTQITIRVSTVRFQNDWRMFFFFFTCALEYFFLKSRSMWFKSAQLCRSLVTPKVCLPSARVIYARPFSHFRSVSQAHKMAVEHIDNVDQIKTLIASGEPVPFADLPKHESRIVTNS